MDDPMDEASQWRSMRERVTRLEQENSRLRSWGRCSFVLNVLILVSALYWLTRPGQPLEAERVSAERVRTGRIFALRTLDGDALSYDGLNANGVLQTVHGGRASTNFELVDPVTPWFTMQHIVHGQFLLQVSRTPHVAFWEAPAGRGPKGSRSRIELVLEGPTQSPTIVLRNADNQAVWQAP